MDTSENSSMTRVPLQTLEALKMAVGQRQLRTEYSTQPITMHKTYPTSSGLMRWPAVIRSAYTAIWRGDYSRVIIKAPRGGGKSKLLGTVGFDLWFLKGRKVVTMGGSEVQAKIVYNYFSEYCLIDSSVTTHVENGANGIKQEKIKSVTGNTFSSVTASPKQIRGQHPDVLISDETCETSDELIDSALPMVNDSEHPQVIMASTFHKSFGRFAEIWDNADEKGYLRIQWDIFDVAAPFPADYWENGLTRDGKRVRDIAGVDKLKSFAKGRTGDTEGWIGIESIVQAWREKPTENWFEVEYLGNRPSSAGLVLKPEDVDSALFDDVADARYNFVQGAAVVMGIDWGFSSMTAVLECMATVNGVVAVIENKNHHQEQLADIIEDIVARVQAHGIRFIYADIGSGNFSNPALRNALAQQNIGCAVIDVNFGTEKFGKPGAPGQAGTIGMLGNLIAYFEQKKVRLPRRFKDAYWQLKNYRYQEGTDKPLKKDDHIPDALMCALKHWSLGIKLRPLHVQRELTGIPEQQNIPGTIKRDSTIEQRPKKKMINAGWKNRVF